MRRFLRRWQPDILHAHRVNSAGWLAAASGFHPTVITPWGSDVFVQPARSSLGRWLARYTLQHADLVTVNSQSMGERVVQLGARQETVKGIQFGVELEIFNPAAPNQKTDLRRRLSFPQDAPVILSTRAIRPNYNIDVILRSIQVVQKSYPGAIFLFIDYNADPDYKKQLDGLIQELKMEQSIRWLSPTRDRAEMADLYRMSDLVISVPSSDATPVSVLEAMACGVPVISSDLLPLHEIITSGENGWFVPAGNSQLLGEAINKLLGQCELMKGLGINANIAVAEKYNYELEMRKMETLYEKLVSSSKLA
jgi:glycosyltransferase involved in cell wall biosynthesis